MKNYDWTDFKPAEKKEALEVLQNAYDGVAMYEGILKRENQFNEYYQEWSHDKARKNIIKWKKNIQIIENDYGLKEVK